MVEAALTLGRGFESRYPLNADSGLGADGRSMGDAGMMGYRVREVARRIMGHWVMTGHRERKAGASLVELVPEKYSRLEHRLDHRSSRYPNTAVVVVAPLLERGLANLDSCIAKSGPEAAGRIDGGGGRTREVFLGC